MKFGEIINHVEKGNLDSLLSRKNILQELGNRYLEKFSGCTSFMHSNHEIADQLSNKNFVNSLDACDYLIDLLKNLPNMSGWLAQKSTKILNKALNVEVKTAYITGEHIFLKTPESVYQTFKSIFKSYKSNWLINKILNLEPSKMAIAYECIFTLDQIKTPIYYNDVNINKTYVFEKYALVEYAKKYSTNPFNKFSFNSLYFSNQAKFEIINNPLKEEVNQNEPNKLFSSENQKNEKPDEICYSYENN
jgi:hypothetical protein